MCMCGIDKSNVYDVRVLDGFPLHLSQRLLLKLVCFLFVVLSQ